MTVEIECPSIEPADRDLQVTMPGGIAVQLQLPDMSPNDLQIAVQMMGQVNSAAAPLGTIFTAIEAILSLKDFAESVPSLITDPGAVAEAIANVIEKTAKLATLIPPLSVPLMVVGLIDVALRTMTGLVVELQKLTDFTTRIETARSLANSVANDALREAAECADEFLITRQQELQAMLGSAGAFIAVINVFLQMIGLDPIPDIDDLPDDPTEAIENLNDVITILNGVRSALPV